MSPVLGEGKCNTDMPLLLLYHIPFAYKLLEAPILQEKLHVRGLKRFSRKASKQCDFHLWNTLQL